MRDVTEICVVIDKSGSMHDAAGDTIGGYNAFLAEQKKLPGEAKVTLILFDTVYKVIYSGVDIQSAPELTGQTYQAGGMTALLDAVGRAIDELGARLAATPEADRPSKVMVAILTDGQENSSREYSLAQIQEKIRIQRDTYAWEFLFLAAGEEAFKTGAMIGLDMRTKGVRMGKSAGDVKAAYASVSGRMTAMRCSASAADYQAQEGSVDLAADYAQRGGTAGQGGPNPAPGALGDPEPEPPPA